MYVPKGTTDSIIIIMSYADDLVLLTKEDMVLQGATDNCKILCNINKCGKKLSNKKLEATIPSTDQKQLDNVQYFNYLGGIITNNERFTREVQYRITMAKAAFNKKKTFSPANWTSILKEETSAVLHLEHSFV
jgi:hypothetical protein